MLLFPGIGPLLAKGMQHGPEMSSGSIVTIELQFILPFLLKDSILSACAHHLPSFLHNPFSVWSEKLLFKWGRKSPP